MQPQPIKNMTERARGFWLPLALLVLAGGLVASYFALDSATQPLSPIFDHWAEQIRSSARLGKSASSLVSGSTVGILLFLVLLAFAVVQYVRLVRTRGEVSTAEAAHSRKNTAKNRTKSELAGALGGFRRAFKAVGIFSCVSNILMLTGAIFMLEVYDRVLPSRSVPTLVGLAIIATVLYAGQAVLDSVRGRVLSTIAAGFDEEVSSKVYSAVVRLPLLAGLQGEGLQPLRDLDTIRGFISGPGLVALFDLPWIPLYLLVIAAFHPLLGVVALLGAATLITMTMLTEFRTRAHMTAANASAAARLSVADAARRNAEAVLAMGMAGRLRSRWSEVNSDYVSAQKALSDVAGGYGSVSRVLRLVLQSTLLAVGAWLVIHQQATAGIIIAGSILGGRALAPVDLAIAHWKNFVAARGSWQRLEKLTRAISDAPLPMALPEPRTSLAVQRLTVMAPGGKHPLIHDVSFAAQTGQAIGVIGPSASGKSTLVRSLVGAWRPVAGRVLLDGASIDQWDTDALGQHIGYLPQDVELFDGTIAENIGRFAADASPQDVIAAAEAAGVHQLILGLPDGYETRIGQQGVLVSAGQRQRIALARALYRDPFLIVLDEPNSNLDFDGELALEAAIRGVRDRGGIVVIVAHKPNVLEGVDLVLVMRGGRVQMFGPSDEVLTKVFQRQPSVASGKLRLASTNAALRIEGDQRK